MHCAGRLKMTCHSSIDIYLETRTLKKIWWDEPRGEVKTKSAVHEISVFFIFSNDIFNLSSLIYRWYPLSSLVKIFQPSMLSRLVVKTDINSRGAGKGVSIPPPVFFSITPEPRNLSRLNFHFLLLHEFGTCYANFSEIRRKILGKSDSFITSLHAICGQNQVHIQTAISPSIIKKCYIVKDQKMQNVELYKVAISKFQNL